MDALSALLLSALALILAARRWRQLALSAPPIEPAAEPLDALARRLGLEQTASDGNLVFRRDGFSVQITAPANDRFRALVDTTDRLPGWLHVVPRRPGIRKPDGASPTHDAFLDKAFWVVGAPRAIIGVLRHPVRTHLVALRNVTIRPGAIESACTASRLVLVEQWIGSIVDLALSLSAPPEDLDRALVTALREEPHPRVRYHALKLLNETGVDDELRQEALSIGLNDLEPDVRCFAALRHRGPEGVAELQGLAGGYEVPENVRLTAFHGLLKLRSGASLVPLLIDAAAGPEGRLSRRALSWAVGYGGHDALKRIVARPRLPVESLRTALDIARRLNATPVSAALINMLEWEAASHERRLMAVRGLGALGTIDSVRILKRVVQTDSALASTARSAITEIQNRCKGDAAGALSLADSDRGQLAVVDAGELAVTSEASSVDVSEDSA